MTSHKFEPNPNAVARAETDPASPTSVPMNDAIRQTLSDTRSLVGELRDHIERLSEQLASLDGDDKLSNFAIQQMMSDYNFAEGLASSVQKKLDCLRTAAIGKI
jgi:hypothetical protein